ncbi:MAG: NUDIX hydrolase [Ignavibacteria bacterium]|nr:NUDIX hydrolase [Ignavibacteria bacterium]
MKTTEGNIVKLVADITVLSNDNVLLVKYSDTNKYDHQSGWFLPDDLVNFGEDPDDAAARILNEQLRISSEPIILDHVETFTGNDRSWHIVFHYICRTAEMPEIKNSDDLEIFKWFSLNELPPKEEVAHHGWALYTIQSITKKQFRI